MSLDIASVGFIAEEAIIDLKKTNSYHDKEIWESAISYFFKDTLFIKDEIIETKHSRIDYTLIFYPKKRKTYLVEKAKLEDFVRNYFNGFNLVEKAPLFYSFLIPLPNIDYNNNQFPSFGNKGYLTTINKFTGSTFKRLGTYTIRITFPNTLDFRENNFDPVFQKDFNSIYEIAHEYGNYLESMFGIRVEAINLYKYILPFYKLEPDELKGIDEIESKIHEKIDIQIRKDLEKEAEEDYQNWFDSMVDEMNDQAFENDPDNYWNID
ncbi:MAG: hypothetical protein JNK20_16350 [Flavipsychrobacter sp.]|nr:hypothetical protein [Flavipsychrobacter sp.]